jgi:hypothetical protein
MLRDMFHSAGKRTASILLLLGLGFGAGGCSLLSEYRSVEQEPIRNPQGHVVGKRETLRYNGTGEELTRFALYEPWRNQDGKVVGYEERTRGGSIIRDLKGNVIGGRWKDLRSRGTNARSRGLVLVFVVPPVPGSAEGAGAVETAEAPRPAGALDYVRLASLHFARR